MRNFEVHPLVGDNRASGLPGDPVRHLDELIRRFGQWYAPREDTTITLLAPSVVRTSWAVDVSHALLTIQGSLPAPSYSGNIMLPCDRDPAANVYNGMTAGWSVPSETGRLLLHAASGRSAWVAKDLSGGAARLSPWWRAPVDLGNVAHGDVFTTHVLPTIAGLNLFVHGGWLEGNTTGLVLRDLDFVDPGQGRRSTLTAHANVVMERCRFSHLPQINGGQIQMRGCYVAPDDAAGVNYFLGNLSPVNVVMAACLSRLRLELGTSVGGSVVAPSFGTLVQGVTGNGFDLHSGGVLRVVDMAIADCTGNGIEAKYGGHVVVGGPLVGDGNAGYGYKGNAGTRGIWFEPSLTQARITGMLGDYLLGSTVGSWSALVAGGGRAADSASMAYLGKN